MNLKKLEYAAYDLSEALVENFDLRRGTSHAIQQVGRNYLEAYFDYEFPENSWLRVMNKPKCCVRLRNCQQTR